MNLPRKTITNSSLLLYVFFQISFVLQANSKIIYNGSGQSQQDKMIAMTIAGIVNRTTPKLYLQNVYETWSYSQTDETWRDIYQQAGNFQFQTISNINDLINNFRSEIKGTITYDPNLTYGNFSGQSFMWQGELAMMIGGLTDCIPVAYNNNFIQIPKQETTTLKDYFGNKADTIIGARLELQNLEWNNLSLSSEKRYFKALQWALDYILPYSNPNSFYLREITDWTVSQRMFQMNLAGTESLRFSSLSDEKAVMIEKAIGYMKTKQPNVVFNVYGWMYPEPLTQWISALGGSFHETLLSNLSWHHVFPIDTTYTYERASIVNADEVNLENKHYVMFLSSEGDAGNWNFGFQSGAWLSKDRGNVPLGWGFNLHFFEQFPFIGQYYAKTATKNDGFIAVTSPLGYTYHDVLPITVLPDAKQKSKYLLQKYKVPSVYAYKHYNGAGTSTFRGVTISNNFDFGKLGAFAKDIGVDLTFLFDPKLKTQQVYNQYGGLMYNHVDDETFYGDVIDLNSVAEQIKNKVKAKTSPSFLLAGYQRFRQDDVTINYNNSSDITIPRLKKIMDDVLSDPSMKDKVEFVTPEKFTALLLKSLQITSIQNANVKGNAFAYSNGVDQIKVNFSTDDSGEKTVILYDITGQQIEQISSTENQIAINLPSQLKKYFIQMRSKHHTSTQLIIH